ncbi:MAG: radical SAM protein [Candidatus Thorarchaeota archaeon]|nr:radical SAM protein [Candidatus Thorarchaeota archaeon]
MSKTITEFNAIIKNTSQVDVLFGYCYPSTYRAGMTGLALHILYSALNARNDTSCERYFRYQTQSPVLSIETGRPLRNNHIIGFTLTYEEDILNLVQMIEMGGIPVLSIDRTAEDPVVIVGGPVVSANPEPYTDFIDAFVIGEGDVVIHNIIESVKDAESRDDVIAAMAEIEGVYVPRITQSSVSRNIIIDLDSLVYPTRQIIPDVEDGSAFEPVFGKSFLLEVTRGCGHSCRFCLVGHICQPRRTRSLDCLKKLVETGMQHTPAKKVSLIGSSLGDLDSLEDLVCWIVNKGLEVSVPSLRADSVSENLLDCLVKGGQRTLTIAPETGSEVLRKNMGKGLSDSDIYEAVGYAERVGYNSVKLYFIIGLPEETPSDIASTIHMVREIANKTSMKVTVSVNPFVPKAQTRWQLEPQPEIMVLRKKIKEIEEGLRNTPRVTVETLDLRSARIQAALSIGDRSLGKVIKAAARYGGFGGWRRAEKETGVPFFSLANNTERRKENLPWSFLQ